ncbi:tetratricopeptide repeat protein [Photobacterium carnosum]|uniref:Sel1 repeat family protein n=2 Tax=Photobacterium carnosum TaxID=2023717 RepID=A0A2N4URK7_9GAMM|nr:tetratricopeptide repeat protein [Photobacterium carnosum]MCD9544329.1 sel1 repeat family protein [Photobacterium carnosum]PLC57652.1 hypothetical protein CIK00_11445 [Photobacterium carnosum]
MNYRQTLISTGISLVLSAPSFAYDLSADEYTQEDLTVIKKAETSANAEVLYNAANILISESMMQENIEQGIKYLVLLAKKNHPKATLTLADYYYEDSHYKEALKLYHQLEQKQDPYVLYSLGVMYFDGEGTQQDYKRGNKYYLAAAKLGYNDAMYQLAFSYNDGQGVKQDYTKAALWFKKSAEQGDASAMYNLGLSYLNGEGVKKDCAHAIKLLEQAINTDNHTRSYAKLGDIYYYTDYKAQCGFNKTDYKKSLSYFMKGAMQGNEYSQYMVGYSYRNGHGTYSNFSTALAWYNIAENNGYDASSEIKDIKQHMSAEDINKAEKLQEQILP